MFEPIFDFPSGEKRCKKLANAISRHLGIPIRFLMVGVDVQQSRPGCRVVAVYYDRASHYEAAEESARRATEPGAEILHIPYPPDRDKVRGFIAGYFAR